jgi:anti-anti-sigma factor
MYHQVGGSGPRLPYHDRDRFRVIAVLGEFDLASVSSLEAAVNRALESGRIPVLDFSQTHYIDSSVLNLIVRKRAGSGGPLRLIVPAECTVRRIFDVTGLTSTLGVVEAADALA